MVLEARMKLYVIELGIVEKKIALKIGEVGRRYDFLNLNFYVFVKKYKIVWLSACWYKFSKMKSWLDIILVGMVKNARSLDIYIYVIYTYVKNEQMEWSKVTFYMLVQIQKS